MTAKNTDVVTRIEILLKLAVIPNVTISGPRVSVENGTVTLGGTVDALWKKTYIDNVISSELPGRRIQNNLTVALGRFSDVWRQVFRKKKGGPFQGPGLRISCLEGDRSV